MSRPPARSGRRRPGLAAALAVTSLVALASCGNEELGRFDDAFCKSALEDPESVDAFEWFKDPHGGQKRLGDWSTDEGLAFAHQLEARGAKRVVAVGIRRDPGPQGDHHADGLVVVLPDDFIRRRSLFELYARMVRSRGFEPQADREQKYVYVAVEHRAEPDRAKP
jgi:hypothetical protein